MTQPTSVGFGLRLSPDSIQFGLGRSDMEEEKSPEPEAVSPAVSAVQFEKQSGFELRLVLPSGRYKKMILSQEQEARLNELCAKITDGKSAVSIDISQLNFVFKNDNDALETKPLYSNTEAVKELRALCETKISPEARMNWREASEEVRGDMAKPTPFARLSEGLKNRKISDEQFENWIAELDTSEKDKARCIRKTAHQFVEYIKQILEHPDIKRDKTPNQIATLQKASDQLDNLYFFAIDFDIAHPISKEENDEQFSSEIRKKYEKAKELLQETSLKSRALQAIAKEEASTNEEIDLLAKKLALNGIRSREAYEAQSKQLNLELEADSLEWAILCLAKAISENGGSKSNSSVLSYLAERDLSPSAEFSNDQNAVQKVFNLRPFKQFFDSPLEDADCRISQFAKTNFANGLAEQLQKNR